MYDFVTITQLLLPHSSTFQRSTLQRPTSNLLPFNLQPSTLNPPTITVPSTVSSPRNARSSNPGFGPMR